MVPFSLQHTLKSLRPYISILDPVSVMKRTGILLTQWAAPKEIALQEWIHDSISAVSPFIRPWESQCESHAICTDFRQVSWIGAGYAQLSR